MLMILNARSATQRGISLVELMVGIAVGMIVTAGASMLAVNQINEHRRMMLETQVQQDLRSAADLLQQDIRRAGFRGDAQLGVWEPPSGDATAAAQPARAASANVYTDLVEVSNDAGVSLQYSYAKPDGDGEYNATSAPANNEYFGVRWNKSSKALYLQIGKNNGVDNWQPVTDPETVEIIDFHIAAVKQDIPLSDFCDAGCGVDGCPVQTVRRVDFSIRARATPKVAKNGEVVRTLSGSERIRADAIVGSCAAS